MKSMTGQAGWACCWQDCLLGPSCPCVTLPGCGSFLPLKYLYGPRWIWEMAELLGKQLFQESCNLRCQLPSTQSRELQLRAHWEHKCPLMGFLPFLCFTEEYVLLPPFKNVGLARRQTSCPSVVTQFTFVTGCFITGFYCIHN